MTVLRAVTFANPYRITIAALAARNGFGDPIAYLAKCQRDTVMDALCVHRCRVLADGRCAHDCPSPLLAAGLI